MATAEALLNMAGVVISDISDIKCSANWMLAVRQPGEGAWLYDAACALRDILTELGVAIDGGKDSLSMASQALGPEGRSELVKAPPELVLAPYALVPDVDVRVTSDLKQQGDKLWLLRVGDKQRLGGSALAQVLSQLGDEAPDIEDAAALKAVFQAVQDLVRSGAIVACHDVSDGGLIVTLLEMAFAGDKGWRVELEGGAEEADLYAALFAEDAGVVVEIADEMRAREILERHGVTATELGLVQGLNLDLRFNQRAVLQEPVQGLHATWEETGYQLERLQITPACADEEWLSHNVALLRARIASASTRTRRSPAGAPVPARPPPRPPSCARKAPTATGRWRPPSSPPVSRPGTSP